MRASPVGRSFCRRWGGGVFCNGTGVSLVLFHMWGVIFGCFCVGGEGVVIVFIFPFISVMCYSVWFPSVPQSDAYVCYSHILSLITLGYKVDTL